MPKGKLLSFLTLIVVLAGGVLFAANSDKQNTDWICIPGKKAGPITAKTSEKELKLIFGPKNVTSSKELGAEGMEEIMATYIYKGTKNELAIRWAENKTFKVIDAVVITSKGANWKTIGGITVGTSLEELNKLNGEPFKFWGFGWDYGGEVSNWGNGNLKNKEIGITLERTANVSNSCDFEGDREFSSDDQGLAKFKVKAANVYIAL